MADARIRRQSPGLFQRHDLAGSFARFWQSTYAPDYAGLVFLFLSYLFFELVIRPFNRMFTIDDVSKQYPHAEVERVPVGWLFVYALAIPGCLLALFSVLVQPPVHKLHVTVLGLLISIFLTTFITDIVKNTVGRPRPDMLDRCQPSDSAPKHSLVTIDVCTQTDSHLLHDGFRSFPSGHSSFAFAGLGFFSLFIASQTHSLQANTPLPTLLLTLAPLLCALLIAISRLEDYRHDVWDVTTGAVLGLTISYTIFRKYYPSLRSRRCDVPHPSKAELFAAARWGILPAHNDEEARVGGGSGSSISSRRDGHARAPSRGEAPGASVGSSNGKAGNTRQVEEEGEESEDEDRRDLLGRGRGE